MTLVDTSVFARRANPAIFEDVRVLIASGRAATCPPVMFEVLHSARNAVEFAAVRAELEELVLLPIGPAEWRRALDVYQRLAESGGAHQRSVPHPDLLAAVAAEAAGAEVLHYDEDFDRIAAITGQPTRWIAPRGSLD